MTTEPNNFKVTFNSLDSNIYNMNKTSHCLNSSKTNIKILENRYVKPTNTWPLIFLAWYKHFNETVARLS